MHWLAKTRISLGHADIQSGESEAVVPVGMRVPSCTYIFTVVFLLPYIQQSVSSLLIISEEVVNCENRILFSSDKIRLFNMVNSHWTKVFKNDLLLPLVSLIKNFHLKYFLLRHKDL